ncbi:MAG: MFS transporter, partial [Proteobacteria bacterium]|nr:MFS transporter [Pseudomonadota bacterium]
MRRFLWRAVAAVILLGVLIPAVVGPVIGVAAGLVALPFVAVIAALA